jgi:hypothetical protein
LQLVDNESISDAPRIALQNEQDIAPDPLNCPAEQGLQGSPFTLNVPATQGEHDSAPALLNDPSSQGEHIDASAALNVPAAQVSHDVP